MYSIRDVALRVGASEAWVRKWIRVMGLGRKIGWAVILNDRDIQVLKGKLHGHQKAA